MYRADGVLFLAAACCWFLAFRALVRIDAIYSGDPLVAYSMAEDMGVPLAGALTLAFFLGMILSYHEMDDTTYLLVLTAIIFIFGFGFLATDIGKLLVPSHQSELAGYLECATSRPDDKPDTEKDEDSIFDIVVVARDMSICEAFRVSIADKRISTERFAYKIDFSDVEAFKKVLSQGS